MPATMPAFDTYKYIRTLRDAGFTEAQAEAQASALIQAQGAHLERLATKDDLKATKDDLKFELQQVKTELTSRMDKLDARMDTLSAELRGEMSVLRTEVRQLKWLSGPVALVAIVWVAKESLKAFGVAG